MLTVATYVLIHVLIFVLGVIVGYYLTRSKAPQLDANDRLNEYQEVTGGKAEAETMIDMALLAQRNRALEDRIMRAKERGLDV